MKLGLGIGLGLGLVANPQGNGLKRGEQRQTSN